MDFKKPKRASHKSHKKPTPTRSSKKPVVPPALISVSLDPEGVTGGELSTGTVALTGPAPSGGLTVSLSSNKTGWATVPTNVKVAAGATTATFKVTTYPLTAPIFGTVIISATLSPITKIEYLSVFPPFVSTLELIGVTTGGNPLTGRVTLTGLAPSNGAGVAVSSSNLAVATVPGNVTVAARTRDKSFPVTTFPVSVPSPVVITANRTPFDIKTVTLTVVPPTLRALLCNPAKGGATSICTVILTGPATAGGIIVNLSSDNTAVITVPAKVTVKAGATKATFFAKTKRVSQAVAVDISASYGGVIVTDMVIVEPL